ncbi:MAG: isoaspartyl peptidase [Bradyrhizobium sp.]|nr:isoaspartyl peptidase [Bradyrhizobium sp.]
MNSKSRSSAPEWTLLVHGGAGVLERGSLTKDQESAARCGLLIALAAGGDVLESGRTALDAVEAAVRELEDDPVFNAGRGAVFTAAGTQELDAGIMDGSTRRAGAVAGVTTTKNPIMLARAVMEQGAHVMLTGDGADSFAREAGLEQADPDWFWTDARWRQLEKLRTLGANGSAFDANVKYGTVGAVARDKAGRLAAATSTGGLTGKRPGRVGDSPIIGAGTYADDRAGAVSATGSGEVYIRLGVAHEICARMRLLGEGPRPAANAVQAEVRAHGGNGGVIVIGADGTPAWSFNTAGMYRGRMVAGSPPVIAIYGDE